MQNDHTQVWNNCLNIIKDNVTSACFRTWFKPIVPLKLNDKVLTIQVPSHFFYEYLEEQYIDILRKTIRKELGREAKLEYNVVVESNNMGQNKSKLVVKYPGRTKAIPENRPVSMPLSIDEPVIKNPFIIPGIQKLNIDPQLNPEYNFGNFVEGECNRLAYSAGLAIAKNPGKTAFNPMFIYGESGLGKTHLSQAIGIQIKETMPEKVVLYVNSNRFQTQYMDAVRKNNINDFNHFYQMIDVLIIDDIHELAGKMKTQQTFYHIFNHLHQNGKQIILTADRPPVELKGLTQRLVSRFKWGLSADLQAPNYDTRKEILKHRIYNDGIEIVDEVIDYIATNIKQNVRELEGAIVSLLAQSTLMRKEINIELAESMLNKLVVTTEREVSIEHIQKTVCDHYKIAAEVLKSKTRKREIVQARQVAMYFSKSLTKYSLALIGQKIGGKDHATVLHACKTVNNLLDTNKKFKSELLEIEKKIKITL